MNHCRAHVTFRLALLAVVACSSSSGPMAAPVPTHGEARSDASAIVASAGFIDVPPRDVTVHGTAISITSTARLFVSFRPAATNPGTSPIVFLWNGYAAEIVRAFGTGPMGVSSSGVVTTNPTPLTSVANLVYVDPRQSGYSYDLPPAGSPATPTAEDCSPDVFNEYVDAGDVLSVALAFLGTHPELEGPVYWMGESYGGVRLTWILTYLRGAWANVPYTDTTLAAAIAGTHRSASLFAGQILLEAWVGGGPEASAIASVCLDPSVATDVAMNAGESCGGAGPCSCADDLGVSLYNYTYTNAFETERETEAITAHIDPSAAATLLGVSLASIPELAPAERSKGWKCLGPDSTIPSEAALESALGPLPSGQVYYLDYSPLVPGKETRPPVTDWRTASTEALAFVDNLHDVPALLTHGLRDLVVPTTALPPALGTAIGAGRVDTSKTDAIGVVYPDGERFIVVRDYMAAGHMITMVQPADFAADFADWMSAH